MSEAAVRHVVCPHCAARNRFPIGRPARGARCGKCHSALFDGHAVSVNAAAFERHRQGNDIAVLVDIWAPWCGPCRTMVPMFEQAAKELEPDVRFLKLNADEEPRLVSELEVRGIPTLILLRCGKIVDRAAGAMSAGNIVSWVRTRIPELKRAGSPAI